MKDKFLELVAKDLLHTYGNNLSNITLLIPGKRARLFMNQYLAKHCEKPVWAPRYQTIDELYLELSQYQKSEQIETICLLYSIYSQLVDTPEPLDEFYSWGELILSDFDDIDKHRAPAEKIFANVYDLHAIEETYITPEQEEALRQFFSNFSIEGNSELKKRFLRLWEIMPQMYNQLREALKQRGMLYAGALYRDVIERHTQKKEEADEVLSQLQGKTYAIVGFNVVDECEEALFRMLGKDHTRFYWDFDELYMPQKEKGHREGTWQETPWEAGLFIQQNLSQFPNQLPREYFDNLRHLKDITFIATSTDNAQARYLPEWIKENLTDAENETAIVLCDEHQLQPVLHAIPEDLPKHINITMGFPLTDTPIFSFLSILTTMQIEGWDEGTHHFRATYQERVKRHPYYSLLTRDIFVHQEDDISLLDYLQQIITDLSSYYANKTKEDDVYDQLYGEALFQTHKVVNRFIALLEEGILNVHPTTLRRLIRNVLSTTSIPFHGEPAIGMQVMGLMETRNLDFNHLLMLNVGEGIMPKKSSDNSLIPFNLRDAFGLTTIRHRISVFAYYFFRLLQRAEHVTLLYNENSTGIRNNEMSRFMRQLMAETDLPIRHIRLVPDNQQMPQESFPLSAHKTPQMLDELQEKYSQKPFSPTAINTYLACPMRFYFKYIAGMYINQEVTDSIEAVDIGNYFHDAAEHFYKDLMEKNRTHVISQEMLKPFLKNKDALLPYIDMKEHESPSGLPLVIKYVIQEYLVQLLEYDLERVPFTIQELETDYSFQIEFPDQNGNPINLQIGGRVDRLDKAENGLVVIDYKTGGKPDTIESVEAIFKHKKPNAGYYFQSILYALAVSHKHQCGVKPTLFYVHQAYDPENYDPSLAFKASRETAAPILDARALEKEFTEQLKKKLSELFNPDIFFCQTEAESNCTYCDYKELCSKKGKQNTR